MMMADEELPEEETSSLIGMIIGTGMHSLTPVNDDGFQGEFDGYDYPLGTRAP